MSGENPDARRGDIASSTNLGGALPTMPGPGFLVYAAPCVRIVAGHPAVRPVNRALGRSLASRRVGAFRRGSRRPEPASLTFAPEAATL
jgi:hypothetical protein